MYSIGLDASEIVEKVKDIKPDIIGISVPFTSRLKVSVEVYLAIREALPKPPIIAGGMHATVDPGILLDCGFDAVILGEAEYSILDLVEKSASYNYSNYLLY